ncbi:hypothetical protein [Cetobacterium sp.]|uniref:hypothetical protein n=1 Tax=Cetobacterium sp. TaxID=2071632 RepID=UPI003F2A5FF5
MKKVLLGLFILGSLAYAECNITKTHHIRKIEKITIENGKSVKVNMTLGKEEEVKKALIKYAENKSEVIHILEVHGENLTFDEINFLEYTLKIMTNIEKNRGL